PTDKCREPACLVLQLPEPLQGLDALGQSFDVAEHHRTGRTAAEPMPDPVNFEPFIGQAFIDGHCVADPVHEDLTAAARKASHPGILEPPQNVAERYFVDLVEM